MDEREKHCPLQVQEWAFRNEHNFGCQQLHWDWKARW